MMCLVNSMATEAGGIQSSLSEDGQYCTIEASVVTGFEESARGEAREKFNTDVKAARGKITWSIPLNKVNDVLKMGSVDNCKVVMHTVPCFQFSDQHDSLARLQKMVKDVNWEIGLQAWQQVYHFPYHIAPCPEVIPPDEDLVDVVIISHQPTPKDKSSKRDKKKGRWGRKKDKRQENERFDKENIAICALSTNIPTEQLPKADFEEVAREELEGITTEVNESLEQTPRTPVNEKGDANAKKEGDLSATHDDVVVLKDGTDSCAPKKDTDASENRHVTTDENQPDSLGRVDFHSQLLNIGKESLRQCTASEVDVCLTNGMSGETTKQIANSVSEVSPIQGSSVDSSLSPVSKKISESEFASIVIRRLTAPQESAPKGDMLGSNSPKMTCVTPPPTPIRSIDNPFSNLQGRLHSELLPFLDSTKLPDRDSVQSLQPNVDETDSSVDQLATNAIQMESIVTDAVSSKLTNVPSLSSLATLAGTEKSGSPRELLTANSENPRRQVVSEESLTGSDSSKTVDTTKMKKERDPTKPTFRVTCFRSGDSHTFDSTSAAASFGSAIVAYFGWQVDLKNFDIEVILNIDSEEVTVSLALTKMSLHYRNLVAFGPTTLRATICYNMLRLCRIKNGDFVCDPMCGTCAIPLEGAQNWVDCFHLGGDIHEKAIEKTALNIAGVRQSRKLRHEDSMKLDALRWDVQRLPLKDSCVDVFVSDLPFGYRVGSRSGNPVLYFCLLTEMARTARPGARACLLTEDKANLIKAIQNLGRYWQRRLILNINIGGLVGFVFLLLRTAAPFVESCTDWRDGAKLTTSGSQGDATTGGGGVGEETPSADSSGVDLPSASDASARDEAV